MLVPLGFMCLGHQHHQYHDRHLLGRGPRCFVDGDCHPRGLYRWMGLQFQELQGVLHLWVADHVVKPAVVGGMTDSPAGADAALIGDVGDVVTSVVHGDGHYTGLSMVNRKTHWISFFVQHETVGELRAALNQYHGTLAWSDGETSSQYTELVIGSWGYSHVY